MSMNLARRYTHKYLHHEGRKELEGYSFVYSFVYSFAYSFFVFSALFVVNLLYQNIST